MQAGEGEAEHAAGALEARGGVTVQSTNSQGDTMDARTQRTRRRSWELKHGG